MDGLTDERRRRRQKFIEPFRLQPGSSVRLASAEEQRRRPSRRLDLPDHRWEFSPADVTERGIWDDYEAAHAAG